MGAELLRLLGLSALASSAAIVLVLVLRKPLRIRFGTHAAYATWLLVPLAAGVALLPAPPTPIAPAAVATLPVLLPAAPATVATAPAFEFTPWLAGAWLLGLLGSSLLLLGQQRRFMRALGRLREVDARTVRAQATAGCPALVGAWRPRIVLPADFEQRYSPTERELILAHEHCHLARWDAQLNVLAAALRCLNWFNPLFHFAASRFRFDQELACDAAVISLFPEARRPYADAMLKTQLADIGLPAGCYWQSSHPLKERIFMLKQPLPGRARRAQGLATAIALVVSGTYAAWAVQPAQLPPTSAVAAAAPAHASYRKLKRIAYPPAALAAKTEGVVYVKIHVGVDGTVDRADVAPIGPAPNKLLAEAAVGGVQAWTFDAAKVEGKPQASDEIVPVVFFLDPNAKPKASAGTLESIRIGPPEAQASAPGSAAATENTEYRQAIPPTYPRAAIAARQQGKIVLKVHVDEHGKPLSADVFEAEPPAAKDIFADNSIAAVMQWQFNPRIEQGKAVAGDVLVPFTYAINDDPD